MPLPETKPGMSMHRWLRLVYAEMRRQYPESPSPGRLKRGRKWISLAQSRSLASLMVRLEFSITDMADLMKARPDLCDALQLKHPPARWSCWRAMQSLTPQEVAEAGPYYRLFRTK